jgi:hypothetical protein
MSEQFRIAFAEDKTILSIIHQEEDEEGSKRVGMQLDAAVVFFRYMVNQRIKDEAVSA